MISNNRFLEQKSHTQSKDLIKLATKIKKIPAKFASEGRIDILKIEFAIKDYHKGRLTF